MASACAVDVVCELGPVLKTADVNEAVGKEIARRRRTLRLSLARLSEQCGVSLQQIHKYETGQSAISVAMLVKLARCLKVRPSELLATVDSLAEAPAE